MIARADCLSEHRFMCARTNQDKRHLGNGALFTIWLQLPPLTLSSLKTKEIVFH